MKISEQAAKAAYECGTTDFRSVRTEIIQRAINDHERDLVEAAEMFYQPAGKMPAVEYYEAVDALKVALDRRKE